MSDLHALVVDDSAVNRKQIAAILQSLPDVRQVTMAGDGAEALKRIEEEEPDFVTLDLEMPTMDGFKFLSALISKRTVPVVVVSGHRNRENVFRALELGAIDFIEKPAVAEPGGAKRLAQQLADKVRMVRQLSPAALEHARGAIRASQRSFRAVGARLSIDQAPQLVVVVGASTGGPAALTTLVSALSVKTNAAIVVAQHMPASFTETFAARLDGLGALRVVEAADRQPLHQGTTYIGPGGQHVEIGGKPDAPHIHLASPNRDARYVPSADRLFQSASRIHGVNVVGVILTGMGNDGAAGAEAIVKGGGTVIVESEDTSVVSGMPNAVRQRGAADYVLPLPELCQHLRNRIAG